MVARIVLRPAELGAIWIRLRTTSNGVDARVRADSQTTVESLERAAAELRRSLEGQGLTLLSLDIGASGNDDQARAHGDYQPGPDGLGPRAGSYTQGARAGDPEPDQGARGGRTVALPNGALLDILA